MRKKKWTLRVEESLNTSFCKNKNHSRQLPMVFKYRVDITETLKNYPEGESLYELICRHIARMRNPYFIKKSGKLDEAGFYTYAYIDKNTWSNIRLDKIVPSKETLLKLVFALQLNLDEANALLNKASNSLTDTDPRDRIVMALIDVRCYDLEDVYDVLEEYGKYGKYPFSNIYLDK